MSDDLVLVRLTEIVPKGQRPRVAHRLVSELDGDPDGPRIPMLRTIPMVLEAAAVPQAAEWGAYCTAEILEDCWKDGGSG